MLDLGTEAELLVEWPLQEARLCGRIFSSNRSQCPLQSVLLARKEGLRFFKLPSLFIVVLLGPVQVLLVLQHP